MKKYAAVFLQTAAYLSGRLPFNPIQGTGSVKLAKVYYAVFYFIIFWSNNPVKFPSWHIPHQRPNILFLLQILVPQKPCRLLPI